MQNEKRPSEKPPPTKEENVKSEHRESKWEELDDDAEDPFF